MNIGIIGLGYMGLHHLKIMRKLLADDLVKAHILHVCDLDEARLDATAEKYGILWEENIHDLDTLLYLLGPLELVSASMDHHAEAPGIDVGTRVELRTEGGSPVHFSSLWHAVEGRGSRRHLELFFDRGLVVTEYFVTGEVLVQSDGGEPVVLGGESLVDEFIAHHGYPARLRHRKQYPWYAAFATLAFLRSVERGEPCQPDFADCLAVHELVEAIYGAAHWNQLDPACGIPRRSAPATQKER